MTTITMKQARAMYRNTFSKMHELIDPHTKRARMVRIWQDRAPGFRSWARAHHRLDHFDVDLGRKPIGKLALVVR